MHSKGSLKIFGREGRIFRTTLVIVMTGMMCVWGIVPSFSVYAEDTEAAASTEQSQQIQETSQETDVAAENEAIKVEGAGQTEPDVSVPSTEVEKTENAADDTYGTAPQVKAAEQEALGAETDGAATIEGVAFESLQAAVDAAEKGDTIILTKDITEYVTVSGKNITIDLNGKTFTAGDNGSTIRSLLLVNGSSHVFLMNGTITGGLTSKSSDQAAVQVENSDLTVSNVTGKGNSGKVMRINGGKLEVIDCLFTNNRNDKKESGAFILGTNGYNGNVVAKNTVIKDNDMSSGKIISVSYTRNNEATLEGCDIINNISRETIGIYSDGKLTLRDTTIKKNVGTGESGGIRLNDGSLYMYDSAVYDNECTGNSYGDDFRVIYEWMEGGEIPLPKDMKDHGVALDKYELVAPRYGTVMTSPVSKANGGAQELKVELNDNDEAVAEYGGIEYLSIEAAVSAMNKQPGTVKILRDAAIAETIEGFDGLVIDLDGHTLSGKSKKRDTLRINGGNVTVKNGAFSNNPAASNRALNFQEASGTVEDIKFENNAGSGLYLYHHIEYKATEDPDPHSFTVKNCEFKNNGGDNPMSASYALMAIGVSLDIQNCRFDSNYLGLRTANGDILTNPQSVRIDGCDFTGHAGNVLEIYSAMNNNAVISNCNFKDNHMTLRDSSNKHIIYLREVNHFSGTPRYSGGSVEFKNCVISNNSGSESTIEAQTGMKTFTDCLIENNKAEIAGGIYSDAMCDLTLNDTVIKGNHVSGTSAYSSGGLVQRAATYINLTPEMVGGVLVIGRNSQNLGYFFSEVDMNGGAIYNNENDNPAGAKDILSWDEEGIINVLDHDEMQDGDFDFASHEPHERSVVILSDFDLDQVFIDPENGDDKNKGNRTRPVKTWDRAIKLLEKYDAKQLHVMNTVTVGEEDEEIVFKASSADSSDGNKTVMDLAGRRIVRDHEFKGTLINVENTELTITNTVIDGMERDAEEALITVNDGASLVLGEGAVLKRNGTAHVNPARGGAVLCMGELKMLDGASITENAAKTGGGVCVYGGDFLMEGGLIYNNKAVPSETIIEEYNTNIYDTYGGGVSVIYNSDMHMTGGTISNNRSWFSGGGVATGLYNGDSVQGKNSFTMDGGVIDNNTADNCGGGVFIQANTTGVINAGSITNNTANSISGWHAGGGIYVNGISDKTTKALNIYDVGRLYVKNVEIARNTAKWDGGAIAWCGTGYGAMYDVDGTVIYDNTSNGVSGSEDIPGFGNTDLAFYDYLGEWEDVEREVGKVDENGKHVYDEEGNLVTEIRSVPTWVLREGKETFDEPTRIAENMMNGASYNWKDQYGMPIDSSMLKNTQQALYAKTDATASDPDVQESLKMTTVHITGNTSVSGGGGIGTNGAIYIGKDVPPEEVEEISEEPEEPPRSEEVKGVTLDPQNVGVKAEVKPAEADPVKSRSGQSSGGTRTGDDAMIWIAVLLLAAAAAAIALYRRRAVRS